MKLLKHNINIFIKNKRLLINDLRSILSDQSPSTRKNLDNYVGKYKYAYYCAISCKKYNKSSIEYFDIIKNSNRILMLNKINSSENARKTCDFIYGQLYAIEESYGIDVRCLGDNDVISDPTNDNPLIHLIFLSKSPFNKQKKPSIINGNPPYYCPKCGNTSKFVIHWTADCKHHVKALKEKSGKYREKKTAFDVKPFGVICLICNKCEHIIKADQIVSKRKA